VGNKSRPPLASGEPVFRVQALRLSQCLAQFSQIANSRHQTLIIPGFLDEIARSTADSFDREIDCAPGRHHNHGQLAVDGANAFQQRNTFLS
jgi:hypothetical protein